MILDLVMSAFTELSLVDMQVSWQVGCLALFLNILAIDSVTNSQQYPNWFLKTSEMQVTTVTTTIARPVTLLQVPVKVPLPILEPLHCISKSFSCNITVKRDLTDATCTTTLFCQLV